MKKTIIRRQNQFFVALTVGIALVMAFSVFAEARMTEVGTPRHETLIVDSLDGRIPNPQQCNPYVPGTNFNQGFHQFTLSHLWDINTVTGEQFPAMAAKMPESLNDDFTKFKITTREGIYWNDGVEFTAEDAVWTFNMLMNTPELPYHAVITQVIKNVELTGKYTLEIETTKPYSRLSTFFGATVWGSGLYILPKHVWESEDPLTFENFPPVATGPYKFTKVDPQGYWFFYERREDWDRSDAGILFGEPGPKYILVRFYGPEEKRLMAGIRHDLDVFCDITPEAWDILRKKNEYAKAWYDNFPWACLDDPCERGITFNNSRPPYDQWQVRWALALATDIDKVAMGTFAGMLRVSPLELPPIAILQETYHKPMTPWLKGFALPDGYKPFDPGYAFRMAERLRKQGVEGIPTEEEAIRDLFGVGWWKFDPEKAAELLEGIGFSRDKDGKWLLPDGAPWKMTIVAPSNFELQSQRLAFAVANVWRKFGIDVNTQQMDGGAFWTTNMTGDFDAGSYWPGCGVRPDVYQNMQSWHPDYVRPTGESSANNRNRHTSEKIGKILDAMAPLTSDDPKGIELTKDLMKVFVEEMPWIQMFGTSKFVPVDTYYWDNFPTAANYYEGPWWWWSNFKYMLQNVKSTGRE